MKALVQSSFLLPVGIARLGSHGTVFRKDDSSRPIIPALHAGHTALLLVSLAEALKRKKKGWWRSREGSDSSPAVSLMADNLAKT